MRSQALAGAFATWQYEVGSSGQLACCPYTGVHVCSLGCTLALCASTALSRQELGICVSHMRKQARAGLCHEVRNWLLPASTHESAFSPLACWEQEPPASACYAQLTLRSYTTVIGLSSASSRASSFGVQAAKQAMARRAITWLRTRALRSAWTSWLAMREERLQGLAADKALHIALSRSAWVLERCMNISPPFTSFERA